MSAIDLWTDLPIDLLFEIGKKLDTPSLFNVVQVCKRWNKELTSQESNLVWKPLAEKYSFFEYPKMNYYLYVKNAYSQDIIYKNYKVATYAASLWNGSTDTMEFVTLLNSPKPIRTCQNFKFQKNKLFLPPYDFRLKKYINYNMPTVQIYEGFEKGDLEMPSQVKDRFWVQAPIPESIYKRFTRITSFSGKFIIYTKLQKIDEFWRIFNAAYQEGRLGYALKAGTAKNNQISRGKERIITVHVENCFDLTESGKVAWEINQLLGQWRGAIHCKLDIVDFFSQTKEKSPLFKKTLFSLNAQIFRKRNKHNKPLYKFISLFVKHTEKICELAKKALIPYLQSKKSQNTVREAQLVLYSNILEHIQ